MEDREIGGRIRRLRIDRGMRQEHVAAALEVAASAVSRIESGERKVSGRELIRLSKLFNVAVRDILGTRKPQPALQMAYRLTQGETSAAGSPSSVVDALEVHALLEEVGAAQVHLAPERQLAVERRLNGAATGQRAARAVRDALGIGLGPLGPLEHTIEQVVPAVAVLGRPVGRDALSGMCVVTEGLSLVFVNTSKEGTRQRFTLAHELAHLLFEDTQDGALADADSALSDASSSVEVRANAFAAELLVPTEAARQVYDRVRGDVSAALATLVFEYGVSAAAASFAMKRVGLLPEAELDRAWQVPRYALAHQFNYLGEQQALEALRDRSIVPTLLLRRAVKAWREGLIGAAPIAALRGISTDDARAELQRMAEGVSVGSVDDE